MDPCATSVQVACFHQHALVLLKGVGGICAGVCSAARASASGERSPPASRALEKAADLAGEAPTALRRTRSFEEVAEDVSGALRRVRSFEEVAEDVSLFLRRVTSFDGLPTVEDQEVVLLSFLRGTGTDTSGRRLADLRAMDLRQMERVHNYIQWMFPTDEGSRFNRDAPMLTPDLQQRFAEDPALRQVLRDNLARFCEFLGLELQVSLDDEEDTVAIVEAPHFFDRWGDCWKVKFRGRNHNWLRISRVLMCLGRCSLFKEQQALHNCLEKLYAEGVPCGPAIQFWRERAQVRPVVPGKCK